MKESCRMHTKGDGSWWENDAKGMALARVCDECIDEKLKGHRPEVLTDAYYDADEPIKPDE